MYTPITLLSPIVPNKFTFVFNVFKVDLDFSTSFLIYLFDKPPYLHLSTLSAISSNPSDVPSSFLPKSLKCYPTPSLVVATVILISNPKHLRITP